MTVTLTRDNMGNVSWSVRQLTGSYVVVGIPGDAPARKPVEGEEGTPPTNAVIGYAMEYGLPDKNVPARPFLGPGIKSVLDEIGDTMKAGMDLALSGDRDATRKTLEHVGTIGFKAVREQIRTNIPPPLSLRTIEARARRGRVHAKKYLKLLGQGTPKEVLDNLGDNALVRTLYDTGQLLNSVTYAVRNR